MIGIVRRIARTARPLAAVVLTALATPAPAQDWSFLMPLTAQVLDVRPGDGSPILFSDHTDPGVARFSVIFHYFDNREGGNALGLNVGFFRRDPEGWRYIAKLPVFGIDPRDVKFGQGFVSITTTTLGPDEPRCCPTQVARWLVDTETAEVARLE